MGLRRPVDLGPDDADRNATSVHSLDMSIHKTYDGVMSDETTPTTDALLAPLRDWNHQREQLPQTRADRAAQAWRHGQRNIQQIAKAANTSRQSIYNDLRSRGIDPTDRTTPVEPPVDATYADMVGSRVIARTTSTVSITGTLRLPESCCGLYPIDLGGGTEVLLHPEQVTRIDKLDQAPRGSNGGHILADHQSQITDDDWVDSKAVHEATHAVIAMIVGLEVKVAWVSTDRTAHVGGGVSFTSGGDVQLSAVHLLAGPLAHARRVAELGYGHLAQAAVDLLGGQGDRGRLADWENQGLIVWRSQAQRDAEILLDTPTVWESISIVAAAMIDRDRLNDSDIRALIGDPRHLTDHQPWHPNA